MSNADRDPQRGRIEPEPEPGRCLDQYPWGQRWITCERRTHRRGKHRARNGVYLVTWKLVGW